SARSTARRRPAAASSSRSADRRRKASVHVRPPPGGLSFLDLPKRPASRPEPVPLLLVGLQLFCNSLGRSAMDRSFYEARWVLVPIFGLMLLIVLAGAMLG